MGNTSNTIASRDKLKLFIAVQIWPLILISYIFWMIVIRIEIVIKEKTTTISVPIGK